MGMEVEGIHERAHCTGRAAPAPAWYNGGLPKAIPISTQMQFLFDLLPVILFFVAYKVWDLFVATGVAIAAAALQVGWTYFRKGSVPKLHLWILVLILVSGGLTLALQDPLFFKWKPTLVEWLFAAVFAGSHFIGDRVMVQRMMGAALRLPAAIWRQLNVVWIGFFLLVGAANLYVAYTFDDQTWVNFKVFGILGLTLVFIVAQALLLSRWAEPVPEDKHEGQ